MVQMIVSGIFGLLHWSVLALDHLLVALIKGFSSDNLNLLFHVALDC